MSDPDAKRGLYRKYSVKRLGDTTHKHDGCWFFVLDPKHDRHAGAALKAYAKSCKRSYPVLAEELMGMIEVEARRRP
jgi:hypothetical protein